MNIEKLDGTQSNSDGHLLRAIVYKLNEIVDVIGCIEKTKISNLTALDPDKIYAVQMSSELGGNEMHRLVEGFSQVTEKYGVKFIVLTDNLKLVEVSEASLKSLREGQ